MNKFATDLIAATMIASSTIWANELEVTNAQQSEEIFAEIEVISDEQLDDVDLIG